VLGVSRIDHGVLCLADDALVERLAAEQTPLTVCPLSNVALRVVGAIEDHPLARMLDSGLNVSVNSDDPAYFGGYVADNYRAVASGLGLSDATLATIAANSLRSAFLDEGATLALLADLDRM
jgi:adenosine deaminase